MSAAPQAGATRDVRDQLSLQEEAVGADQGDADELTEEAKFFLGKKM